MIRLLGPGNHRTHHFTTRSITQRMDDPMVTVPALSTQFQHAGLGVELGSPLDEFSNSSWSLTYYHVHNLLIAECPSSSERVIDVIFKPIIRIKHAGNPTLSIVAARLQDRILRDDHHRLIIRDCIGST